LICRFCEQWNPDGAARCSFCHNAPGATDDETSAAQRAFAVASPPQAARPDPVAPPARTPTLRRSTARRREAQPKAMLVALAAGALLGGFALLVLARACGGH
jgi:hypothetical protein